MTPPRERYTLPAILFHWLLVSLVVLHSAGALRHALTAGDPVLRRMLP